ncbi:MAG: hypothetical protein ACSW8F_03295 [bacterium]
MLHNKAAISQVLRASGAEAVAVALMLGAYALLGKLSGAVLVGALIGFVLSVGNFLALSVSVSRAADKAEAGGNPVEAANRVRLAGTVRLFVLFGLYYLVLQTGAADPLAAVLPLLLMQLAIRLTEYFRKEDENGTWK